LKKEIKRIVVLGAGAVGCFFGGMLARSGKEVLLIARDNHVQAIKKNGLFMECQSFQEHVAVDASSSMEGVADADLILCCVKSPDTERAMREIKDLIKSDALILSLQNGVDNA
jgi:2-dehydropantoate 2-reductase